MTMADLLIVWKDNYDWLAPTLAGVPGVWANLPGKVRSFPLWLLGLVWSMVTWCFTFKSPEPTKEFKELSDNLSDRAVLLNKDDGFLYYKGTKYDSWGQVHVKLYDNLDDTEPVGLNWSQRRTLRRLFRERYAKMKAGRALAVREAASKGESVGGERRPPGRPDGRLV